MAPSFFLELCRDRQSTRAFSGTPVDGDKIERCLEAARLAPSACNGQPWYFIVVQNPVIRERIARSTFAPASSLNHFTLQAQALVLVLSKREPGLARLGSLIRGLPLHYLDIGIAIEHFCLQATNEGLGTCILGWITERKIRKHLKIPKAQRVVAGIAVGYPESNEIRPKKRKQLNEIRSYV